MEPNEYNSKIIIQLSEHDALQLCALIRREINQGDRTWQPYWERLAQCVENSIERANFGTFKLGSHSQESLDKPQ